MMSTMDNKISLINVKIWELEKKINDTNNIDTSNFVTKGTIERLISQFSNNTQSKQPNSNQTKEIMLLKVLLKNALTKLVKLEEDNAMIKNVLTNMTSKSQPTNMDGLKEILKENSKEIAKSISNIKIPLRNGGNKYSTINKQGGKFIPKINNNLTSNINIESNKVNNNNADSAANLLKQLQEGKL